MTGWKTLVLNGSVAALMLAAEIVSHLSALDWRQLLPEGGAPSAIIALGIANIVLRHVTTGPAAWRRTGQ